MAESLLSLLLALSDVRDAESLRFLWCAEQGWDSSCGLAAVSSLMDIYWSVPASEAELASDLIARRGGGELFPFSFADMIALLGSRGFRARAYRMSLEQLASAMGYAPIIAHYDKPEGHFVLLLSVGEGLVVTADPAQGLLGLSEEAFLARWSGNVLLVARPGSAAGPGRVAEAAASAIGRWALLEREAAAAGVGLRGGPR